MKIIIKEQEIILRFNLGFLRALGNAWGCNGPAATIEKFYDALKPILELAEGVDPEKLKDQPLDAPAGDIPFDTIDALIDVVKVAAKYHDASVELDYDDVGALIFSDPQLMLSIVSGFIASIPKVREVQGKFPMPVGEA